MKTKYQVWGYNADQDDFTLNHGEHEDLKNAISIADNHVPAIVELIDYDEEGNICNVNLTYCAFENEESEIFFKQKFPHLF